MDMATKWRAALALAALISLPLQAAEPVKVGSKIDTEGALLGNIILQVLESHGVKTVNKVQLGTTPVVRGAITAGELDIYPEYTGNGAFFFKQENDPAWKNARQGYEKVKKLDAEQNKLIWLTPAPANNTWTIAVRQDLAEKITSSHWRISAVICTAAVPSSWRPPPNLSNVPMRSRPLRKPTVSRLIRTSCCRWRAAIPR